MAVQTPAANPALASLQDIQTPTEIGLWPLAYGYWLLLLVVLISVAAAFIYLRKRRQHTAAKRAALVELAKLDPSTAQYITNVSEILKRAAMSYCDRSLVAGLSGTHWYAWLTAQVNSPPVELCELLKLSYQRTELTQSQAIALKQSAEHWLKSALPLDSKRLDAALAVNMEAK
ncbi:DUF4381 domain-containing protein [Shewanella sp. Choline-02u-19]|uniref:DUF4381 domain-containing protein n=1 Tax=unclassified Shewanella TaxID=196818 RepID=UPI000C324773|nr:MULTISPECIES: DUF4381 domain-containing protein [unclassified Shewanella]PKG58922.1 DUF4381 domain-containing protein [Shewanella sp. GutDb-MelDb]PKG73435.1 DUF4381 domain-containing protein [Shewanella sp. GutCb]PKH60941.1 DUF4381 domain-containing protein [Shewanella sp. Bg11-22]PKI28034.1 DUF4381 domain-containing protein [Shewanella sp. Choline-02u-19]